MMGGALEKGSSLRGESQPWHPPLLPPHARCTPPLGLVSATLVAGTAASARTASAAAASFFVFDI
jgi:hypothetical protein